jgi:hypothetical protein
MMTLQFRLHLPLQLMTTKRMQIKMMKTAVTMTSIKRITITVIITRKSRTVMLGIVFLLAIAFLMISSCSNPIGKIVFTN